MTILLSILFTLAWAALAFGVIRALVIAYGLHRRFAGAAAVAAAGAFALGALSPFSLWRREAPPVTAPATATVEQPAPATHPIGCPAHLAAVRSPAPSAGHIDAVTTGDHADNPAAQILVGPGQALQLSGWVAVAGGPASGMCVFVDGKPVTFEGSYGYARPDVATALANPADRSSGFEAVVRTLPPGVHVVTVGPVESDGAVTPVVQTLKVLVR